MPHTRRPWLSPRLGNPDFIIRSPARLAHLMREAESGSQLAAALLSDHRIAIRVMFDLADVLDGYRATISNRS